MDISESIYYVGVEDPHLDLFEAQYPLEDGVTYNSYVIMDKKIAVMDSVDVRAKDAWLYNLESVLKGRMPDYLVVSHMEPDHSASIDAFLKKYPDVEIVGNAKTFTMLDNFFHSDFGCKRIAVKENEELELGKHKLVFYMTPMVHWPEVMMTYESTEQVLFSADAFGTFGIDKNLEYWDKEARRYYFNIVGKYGKQVSMALAKLPCQGIRMICPLHGPILKEDLENYLHKYRVWSSYLPQKSGVVIACASIYGHTMEAMLYLKEKLEEEGEEVILYDLSRVDVSYVLADIFAYDRVVFASASYDGGVFTPMNNLLHDLVHKNFQNRGISFVENGSWAPSALKTMKCILEPTKDMEILGPEVTIKSSLSRENIEELNELVTSIVEGGCQREVCV